MYRLPFLLLLAGLATVAACSQHAADPTSSESATYLNTGPAAAYVGIDACKSCHATQYDTFIESEMGRSFKRATHSKSAAEWEDVAPVFDPHADLYYQPFRRGEDLFMVEFRLSGADTVHRREEKIAYIVGSGQHTNSHIMDVNGFLYQMPLTWYAQDGKWDLPPKFGRANNYRFSRPIQLECMACHNARPAFINGSENRFSRVPEGIDCEQCHGPGSIHVREMQAGRVVDITREIDYTIVNPRKLPADLQIDVCRRCHMQGAAVYRDGRTALDFRPGQRLADTENVFWPRFPDSTTHFIMASHPDRMMMSRCFTESHAEDSLDDPMTCVTCHDPHIGIKTVEPLKFDAGCQSCHAAPHGVDCALPEVERVADGGTCASCHMPESGSIDIPHVRITDHFIRKPDDTPGPAKIEQKLVRLASLIETSPTSKDVADGYMTYFEELSNHPGFLDSASVNLGRERRTLPAETLARSLIRLWYLQKNYETLTAFLPSIDEAAIDDGWTLYRIGEAYYQKGDLPSAIRYLERANERAPDHLRFRSRLGSAYTAAGRLDDAILVLDRLIADDPTSEEAYNNRGFTRILQRQFDDAERDFQAAIALNPDAEQSLANLASLYYNTDRVQEARPIVRHLLALNPDHGDYQMLWRLVSAN